MSPSTSRVGHIFRMWSQTSKNGMLFELGQLIKSRYIKTHKDLGLDSRWFQCRDFECTKIRGVFCKSIFLPFLFRIWYALFRLRTFLNLLYYFFCCYHRPSATLYFVPLQCILFGCSCMLRV